MNNSPQNMEKENFEAESSYETGYDEGFVAGEKAMLEKVIERLKNSSDFSAERTRKAIDLLQDLTSN